jgi:hypothetical protein
MILASNPEWCKFQATQGSKPPYLLERKDAFTRVFHFHLVVFLLFFSPQTLKATPSNKGQVKGT